MKPLPFTLPVVVLLLQPLTTINKAIDTGDKRC